MPPAPRPWTCAASTGWVRYEGGDTRGVWQFSFHYCYFRFLSLHCLASSSSPFFLSSHSPLLSSLSLSSPITTTLAGARAVWRHAADAMHRGGQRRGGLRGLCPSHRFRFIAGAWWKRAVDNRFMKSGVFRSAITQLQHPILPFLSPLLLSSPPPFFCDRATWCA